LIAVAPAGGITLADGPIAVMRPLVTTIVACSIGAPPLPSMTRGADEDDDASRRKLRQRRRGDRGQREGRDHDGVLHTYFSTFQLFHFSTF
jgi:hypothetical protein